MRTTAKETVKICCLSWTAILVLCGFIVFSPMAAQFWELEGLGRGISCESEIDQLVEAEQYQAALDLVNSKIEEGYKGIPRVAYFDRFLSKEKRYEATLARVVIYELQWKRIEILSMMGDYSTLRQVLKKYTSVIGYHQEDAKEMLNQMDGK